MRMTRIMQIRKLNAATVLSGVLSGLISLSAPAWAFHQQPVVAPQPDRVPVSDGWQLQDAAKLPRASAGAGAAISKLKYQTQGWYPAVVPGTVLTTLVKAGVYPEPLYGENNRPDRLPESLNKTSYWYRTVVQIPAAYKGRRTWLNLDGINFSAEVWVNGTYLGTMRGAFKRGIFDISEFVKPGEKAAIAVRVTPQPHPGDPHEHTIADGMVTNGGITAIDGPTFLSTIGWDWLPGIRDRNSGIWAKVFLFFHRPGCGQRPTGHHRPASPPHRFLRCSHLQATLENVTDAQQKGTANRAIRRRLDRKGCRTSPARLADRSTRSQGVPGSACAQSKTLVAQRLRPAEPLRTCA